jgi:phage FluMu protein Com
MNEIRFCSFCGKILEGAFHYCPYCGTQCKDVNEFEAIVDASLREMQRVRASNEMRRLEKMETMLRELEEELDTFLAVKST